MNVKLLRVDTQGHDLRESDEFYIRVILAIDGVEETHAIHVRPRVIGSLDASLLVASDALQDRLRLEQYALHRICRLVGQELRGHAVRLPQFVAA